MIVVMIFGIAISCQQKKAADKAVKKVTSLPEPDVNNGNIKLPANFGAIVVDPGLGKGARHVVVRKNGDIYVKMQKLVDGKGIIALRDIDGDGKADVKKSFGDYIGTGIDLNGDYLYASSSTTIYRYLLKENEIIPKINPDTLVSGFPKQNDHWSKSQENNNLT